MNRYPIKIARPLFANFRYFECANTKPVYRPLVPLTQQYSLIFNHKKFAKCQLIKAPSIFWYWIPAGVMMANNFLTQWNTVKSLVFLGLLAGGLFVKGLNKDFNSLIVYSLQVDPNLKYVYLTVNQSSLTMPLAEKYQIKGSQKKEFLNSYHPLKQINPNAKIISDYRELKNHAQLTPDYKATRKIQNQVYRLKIPRQDIKFEIMLQEKDKPEFGRDLNRLSIKQMLRKYQNHRIQAKIQEKIRLQIILSFLIQASENNNKRYHDYLLSMVLGYDIDLSGNKLKKNTKAQSQQIQKQAKQQVKQKKQNQNE